MSKLYPHAPEFSHPLSVDKIAAAGMEITLDAREKECQALAERFGLLDLTRLHAVLTIHPVRNDQAIEVSGRFSADVVQSCVVTLEPLAATVEKELRTFYVEAATVDPDDENMEPLTNGIIDLGELVAQHLATALDPYPRKPGLAFVEAEYGEAMKVDNPFAKLAAKKDK